MMTQSDILTARYQSLAARLADEYGYPTWRQHLPPIDELVLTILSQNTSDSNSFRAFDLLKARYPNWEAVRDADGVELIETIRTAGLANQKGPRIQETLRYLTATQGEISLEHLRAMSPQEGKAWLTAIKGIGHKTASIVLLFSLNKPAFPVDTHVHRVTTRLGLVDVKMDADRAHQHLEDIVPPEDYYAFHLQIIQHGREVCHARNPKCGICALQADCEYFRGLSKLG